MVAKRIGKRYGGPWYSQYSIRMNFELDVNDHFSQITVENVREGHKLWREYRLVVDVPGYEQRIVTVKLFPNKNKSPRVKVDGPSDSPHRYDDGHLCMWYPMDLKENRWIFSDGLLHLLVLIQAHLFREAWWREKNEWLGPEKLHNENIELTM